MKVFVSITLLFFSFIICGQSVQEKFDKYISNGFLANGKGKKEVFETTLDSARTFLEDNKDIKTFVNYNMLWVGYNMINSEKAAEVEKTKNRLLSDMTGAPVMDQSGLLANITKTKAEEALDQLRFGEALFWVDRDIEKIISEHGPHSQSLMTPYSLKLRILYILEDYDEIMLVVRSWADMAEHTNYYNENIRRSSLAGAYINFWSAYVSKQEEDSCRMYAKKIDSIYALLPKENRPFPSIPKYYQDLTEIIAGTPERASSTRKDFIKDYEHKLGQDDSKDTIRLNLNIYGKVLFYGWLGDKQYRKYNLNLANVSIGPYYGTGLRCFKQYAYYLYRDGFYKDAVTNYDITFDVYFDRINRLIFALGEEKFLTVFQSQMSPVYDDYFGFTRLAQSKNHSNKATLAINSLNNLLFIKSIGFKSTKKRRDAFVNSENTEVKQLYEEWRIKQKELVRAYYDDNKKNEIARLTKEVNQFENELANKTDAFVKTFKLARPEWTEIQTKLKDGEKVVEMVRFTEKTRSAFDSKIYYAAYIFDNNSTTPEILYLDTPAEDLEGKYLKTYKAAIKYKIKDNQSFEHYWKQIYNKTKGAKKIYFSPAGVFNLINIPSIFNTETQNYILKDQKIHYLTSSAEIIKERIPHDIETGALFGRPKYNIENPTLIASSETTHRGFIRGFRGTHISDLPGTETEVTTIEQLLKSSDVSTTLSLGQNATEEALYQINSPTILHIATHGFWSKPSSNAAFSSTNALLNSGLLLAGVENYYNTTPPPETSDGILTAFEAQNLDLEGTDLVILSACETGLGDISAGEGVFGLQRAFRSAGAHSTITSLWKVDDAATRDFMISLYKHYLESNDKYEAFRLAQLHILEKYKDPMYWGAFIFMGQ